jgi:uncharacterized protein
VRKFLGLIAAIILVLGTVTNAYSALDLPDSSYEFYVYDEAGVISDSLKNEIISVNRKIEAESGAQIVVAVVENIEGSTGTEEYANELFEKWQIGDSEQDNGILMLVAMEERAMRLEIGYGLEGAIPDGRAGDIRDEYILPYFSQEDYNTGIRNGFYALAGEVAEEYGITDLDISEPEATPASQDANPIFSVLGGIGLAFLIILDLIFFRGMFTFMILRMFLGGRGGGGSGRGRGGGGSSGGGGAGGRW